MITDKDTQKLQATNTNIDTEKTEQKVPANDIRDQIHRIIQEDKWQACALVLCILFDDGFNTDWLEINSTPKEKKAKLQEIVTECEIHFYCSTSITSLKSAFASLEGTYLTGILTEYRMIDVKMYKMVAVICGQHFTECFIKYAFSKLIRDHFLFESVNEVKEKDDRIMLSKDKEGKYFKTLLFDLMDLNIVSTFHNKQLKYPSFLSKLITFWKRNEDAKKILKDLDLKGFTHVRADYENKAYWFATTPLIESASGGYVEIVRFLIKTVDCKVSLFNCLHGNKFCFKSEREFLCIQFSNG